MEFVSGLSLHELLVQDGAFPAGRVVEIMSATCAGVAAAHRQKIVHRDIKPLNIMLQEGLPVSEGLKVLDFGLAKIKSGELLGSFVQAQTTGLMGSPFYMAPEQWSDEEPDARADIYSLGILMYQMLTGDVPFKGNGIPAIMKKHLTMDPPAMASWGVNVPAPIEAVVRHALQKERSKRPASAELLLEELRQAAASVAAELNAALGPEGQKTVAGIGKGVTTNSVDFATSPLTLSQPTTTLHLRTYPAHASIFVNNVPVGVTDSAGDLSLRNMLQGNHRLMVAREGYVEWVSEVVCDDGEFNLEIALDSLEEGQAPGQPTTPGYITLRKTGTNEAPNGTYGGPTGRSTTAGAGPNASHSALNPTMMHGSLAGSAGALSAVGGLSSNQVAGYATNMPPAPAPRSLTPLILAVLAGFLLLGGIGAYALFVRPATDKPAVNGPNGNPTTPDNPTGTIKAELIAIPGGTFKMGRKSGLNPETPEHAVSVKPFAMDKTEVTNAQYAEFVRAAKYPAPSYFDQDKPPAGQEQMPVCKVSIADVEAFAKWRSARDGVTYRLPTEEEWEFAARNGEQNTVYPWGNTWTDGYAATNEAKILSLQPVGAYPNGQNRWGVLDLIGNVWEWTSSKASFYPGNPSLVVPQHIEWHIVRGGSFTSSHTSKEPISSAYRNWVDPTDKGSAIGFRLARSGS